MMNDVFHPMAVEGELPARLNDPFDYEPHPLCMEAARQVCDHVAQGVLRDEVMQGKMLGVLVCQTPDGQVGFLAAYSGQLGGRADWPWFVPAVFDYLQPDGYFKQEEARISAINAEIVRHEQADDYVKLKEQLQRQQTEAEQAIAAFRQDMAEKKRRRDALRLSGNSQDEAALVRESQFLKAELRRLKASWRQAISATEAALQPMRDAQERLRQERHLRSDALQRWLFDHFVMVNSLGEQSSLTAIFSHTPQGMPPSGTGECCAPKLLQYAFLHHLRPLSIAEFWQGPSPRMEVRHHGQYYPACRGKCKPLLGWMLQTLSRPLPVGRGADRLAAERAADGVKVVYADEVLLVVDKPSGLLSVPGLTGENSVESLLGRQYGDVYMVHRLDQDTSGLMVVARTIEAYHALQQQFLARTIYKMYIAVVEGVVDGNGTIHLPLRPYPLDRPRQVVDHEQGKEAVTDYSVLAHEGNRTRLALTPHTGRTHQLRMHCAHQEGLGCPIVGDRLYGKPAERLLLHAAKLTFTHPSSGERLAFTSPAPF